MWQAPRADEMKRVLTPFLILKYLLEFSLSLETRRGLHCIETEGISNDPF